MAQVTIIKDGKKVTVEETTPGLFGRMGYKYVSAGDLTLPSTEEITQDRLTLPQQTEEPNPLLDFKDTLSQVTDLARNKRNETSLKFMSPFRGTVAALDFSSILSNLNRASERFTTEATERLLPEEKVSTSSVVTPTPGIPIPFDIENLTSGKLKTQIKNTFDSAFANKIILDFTDEQLKEFIRDYQATQNELRQSIDPEQFLVEWLKETGIGEESKSSTQRTI